jgi:hypothetical protein
MRQNYVPGLISYGIFAVIILSCLMLIFWQVYRNITGIHEKKMREKHPHRFKDHPDYPK